MSHWESVGKSDEWYTPQYVMDALDCEFDLDIAAPECGPYFVKTKDWFYEDSLNKELHLEMVR